VPQFYSAPPPAAILLRPLQLSLSLRVRGTFFSKKYVVTIINTGGQF
jgi:hypothetical protein